MPRRNSQLRVLEIITALDIGGAEVQLLRRAQLLAASGLDVTVCSLTPDGLLFEEFDRHGIRLIALDSRGIFDPLVGLQLLRLVRRCRPDVVHCHLFRARLWGLLVARLARVGLIIQTEHMLTRTTFEARKHTPLNRLAGFVLGRLAHVTLAISPNTASTLERIHRVPRNRIEYVPNGILLAEFPPPTVEPVVHVTALGRLHELKGFQDLVDAIAILRRSGVVIDCEIAGDGPMRDELSLRIASSGLTGSVRLVGPKLDAASFMVRGTIFVMPSRTEGFGIAALEAMAVGVPVIASRVDGLADLVEHGRTGILVPAAQPKSLADAIRSLLDDDELRADLARRGRAAAELYSLETSTRALIEIYRRAHGRRATSSR